MDDRSATRSKIFEEGIDARSKFTNALRRIEAVVPIPHIANDDCGFLVVPCLTNQFCDPGVARDF